jgi:DNA-directed RNA polymerase subunit RPC12/RpoP
LQGRQTCPNCGGELELAGKGLITCPYCGAEIFLGPSGVREIESARTDALSAGGRAR